MTIEMQLFDWEGWDGDQECMIFYNPVLKVQIGKHAPGTKFDAAIVSLESSVLQLQNYGPEIVEGNHKRQEVAYNAEYELKLVVGNTLGE